MGVWAPEMDQVNYSISFLCHQVLFMRTGSVSVWFTASGNVIENPEYLNMVVHFSFMLQNTFNAHDWYGGFTKIAGIKALLILLFCHSQYI